MPVHTIVNYTAALAQNSVLATLGAPSDPMMSLQNGAYQLPIDMRLAAALAVVPDGTRVMLNVPSLWQVGYPYLQPFTDTYPLVNRPPVITWPDLGARIGGTEEMRWQVSRAGAAAAQVMVATWLATDPVREVTGNIFTVAGSAAVVTQAGAWASGPITLDYALQAGKYDVVGMSVFGSNAFIARLVPFDSTFRPGCVVRAAQGSFNGDTFNRGKFGRWLTFSNTTLPQLEVFGTGATATQTVYLDLIRR